ncbi:AbrB/MazE/SpoVT family DNA-binding domain-containing protein [Oleiagrimonas sp.]|jgi:antitoxin MazE|uniref:AbrB/MazE/SpoVT family DNA-binding domain-containing protein n=1 Tax=Oleiagrimonas sp. TaxID=2010330 RepID=UPI0026170788|nr:AbrB/MazE/SpoVT family DNA-binding domain-containing protein [Oleiagrimonas sp.]MDA3912956.1 AbrB/MazE/SpoVT family DNA-binding domain-containing protein [Oleiagrimonas sp.]
MHVIVKKWGNSAAVRIPASIMKSLRLRPDDPVEVRAEDGRIVISPLAPRAYKLARLVDAITAENLQDAADFGPAVGQEAL